MVLHYTRETLEMPSVFAMVGIHNSCHHVVCVVEDSQWNMHLAAAEDDEIRELTTKLMSEVCAMELA